MATAASTLITRVLDNLSRASTGTTRSGVTLANKGMDWLNDTQLAMARKHNFREMLNLSESVSGTSVTADATKTYTFPTGWKSIINIRIIDGTDSRKLIMVPRRRFDEIVPYPENDTEGIPCYYIPYGNSFDVYPIPDYLSTTLTGSIDPTASTTVLGVNTLFTTELAVGDMIRVTDVVRTVATIVSNTELTVTLAYTNLANDTSPEKVENYVMPVRYYKWPTVITATTDTITFGTDKDDIVVSGMTSRAFRYLQMYEDGIMYEREFADLLKRAIDADDSTPDWDIVGKGFEVGDGEAYIGEYWRQPFIEKSL